MVSGLLSKPPYGGESRGGEVLDTCEKNGIPFVPYFSLVQSLPKKDDRISTIAKKYNATEAQINLSLVAASFSLDITNPRHFFA